MLLCGVGFTGCDIPTDLGPRYVATPGNATDTTAHSYTFSYGVVVPHGIPAKRVDAIMEATWSAKAAEVVNLLSDEFHKQLAEDFVDSSSVGWPQREPQ